MKPSSRHHTRLRMAVIGTGTWGRNWVRVLQNQESADLAWIVDPDPSALDAARPIAPTASAVVDVRETGYDFEAAVICTPSENHADHATALLHKGKHLLVEKPLAMSARTASALIATAATKDVRLMAGHQLLYHPVFARLQHTLLEGAIGELRSITAERTGQLRLRREHGVLWSYGPHDVAMILSLVQGDPVTMAAKGQRDSVYPELSRSVEIDLMFERGVKAHLRLAVSDVGRTRRLQVVGSKGALTFDDAVPGGTLVHTPADPSEGMRLIPVEGKEPLAEQARHFIELVFRDTPTRTGPEHALQVTKILETANASF